MATVWIIYFGGVKMPRETDKKMKDVESDEIKQPVDEFRHVRGSPVRTIAIDKSKLEKYDSKAKVEE